MQPAQCRVGGGEAGEEVDRGRSAPGEVSTAVFRCYWWWYSCLEPWLWLMHVSRASMHARTLGPQRRLRIHSAGSAQPHAWGCTHGAPPARPTPQHQRPTTDR